jgi:two-component sensor histidine kinase
MHDAPTLAAGALPEGLPPRQHFGYRLALTVLVGLVPVVAFAGFLAWHELGVQRDELEQALTLRARLLSQQVDSELDQSIAALRTLSISPALAAEDPRALRDGLVPALSSHPNWLALSLVEPRSGQIVASTLAPPGARLPVSRSAEIVRTLARTREPQIGFNLPSAESLHKGVLIGIFVPVRRGEEVAFALGAALAPAIIQRLFASQGLPPEWLAVVTDQDGRVVARTRDPETYVGRRATDEFLTKLQGRESGIVASTTLEGETVYTAFQRSARTGWLTLAAVDRSTLDGLRRRSFWALFLTGSLSLFLTATATLLVHHGTMQRRLDRARRTADERQALLVREMHHRVKNTLATVQALISSSARSAKTVEEFREAIVSRIAALAKTHMLLTSNERGGAFLEDVLRTELEPFDDPGASRINLSGPPVGLPAEIALAFGLAIHELTTNAVKYGALSLPGGRVLVRWKLNESGASRRLSFEWVEEDGPPVTPSDRQGFGMLLLERVLGRQLQGEVRIDLGPAGLRVSVEAPLPDADDGKAS